MSTGQAAAAGNLRIVMESSGVGVLLSVVVCTYNRAELLPGAIRSVLDQSYEGFEVVVVDDGSTDSTADVVARVGDPRVGYVRQENQGLSVARNTGVAHASGRYVVFLDDDDTRATGVARADGGSARWRVRCGVLR